jgi:hypothetical protein
LVYQVWSEVGRVSLHLSNQDFMVLGIKKLKVMFSPADFQSCIVEKHNQSLLSVLWSEVDLFSLQFDRLFDLLLNGFLEFHDCSQIEIIIALATRLLSPFFLH